MSGSMEHSQIRACSIATMQRSSRAAHQPCEVYVCACVRVRVRACVCVSVVKIAKDTTRPLVLHRHAVGIFCHKHTNKQRRWRAKYVRLLARERTSCIEQNICDTADPALSNFTRLLLKTAEHTFVRASPSPSSSLLCCIWLLLSAWCNAFKLRSLHALHRTAWLLRDVIN